MNLTKYYNTYRKRKQTYQELWSMTDRELQDIGLTRGDIPQVVKEIR